MIGRRFARGHYLEDQLLTDRRALVVPRVGTAYGVPLDHIESVELMGTKATFTGEEGQFRFSFVRRHRALRKALETGAPHISFEAALGPELRRVRLALVTAPCARIAIAALTAICSWTPVAAGAADLRPCAGGARCGSVTVPLVAADPAAGNVTVGFEVYAHRGGGEGARHDPRQRRQ